MRNNIAISQLVFMLIFLLVSCKKAEVGSTAKCTNNISAPHSKGLQFQALLSDYVGKGLPGMSLLVSDSEGVWYGAAGKADLKNKMDYAPCTTQKLGSVTKMMVAVMIMKLVEEGKVNIDDKISKWLDASLLKNIENAEKVTLRNCLQHTTGIYDIISNSDFYLAVLHNPNKHWKGEELLAYLKNQPAMFEANTSARYSNSNFLFLSMCVEKITGQKHSDLMREKLFEPLEMKETYYHTHDELPATTAQGYFDLYNNNTLTNVSNISVGNGNGHTGVYSNIFDLKKFVEGVFLKKSVITKASLDTMMQWIQDMGSDNSDFGLGLFRKDTDKGPDFRVGHTGGDLGYASEVYYFPKNGSFYILNLNYGTNGESFLKPVYNKLIRDLPDLVLK